MSARPSPRDSTSLAHLRARLERRFALRDLPISLAGAAAPLLITAPADPDAPLDQMAAQQAQRRAAGDAPTASVQADEPRSSGGQRAAAVARATVEAGAHLPYWALLWPSGLALAEALLAEPTAVQGKRTLELGCGLGVTAAVACRLGARLTISDLFDDALLFAEYNVRRCTGSAPATLLLNWRTSAGRERLLSAAPCDLLLAADVLYEPEDIEPLLALAPRLLRPGAPFWLAEPGRKASRAFVEAALARGWRDHPSEIERAWPPDDDMRRVVIHRFSLPGE
ncbi:MAG: class I SAM-dependent methyltransferase [Ktedonobacterales bacterium]